MAMTVTGPMALRDVKNHLSEVVDQVEREHDRVIITKHGRPAAVVVSVDDLARRGDFRVVCRVTDVVTTIAIDPRADIYRAR